MDRGCCSTCGVGAALSVTATVKLLTPVDVGVPDRTPAGLSLNPLGKAPDASDQV
jgi:hypothetical protein